MDFVLNDDQAALQQELRRFLATRLPSEGRRALIDRPGAVDRVLWAELAEMGIFGVTVPEADGGIGLGLADATIVFEELGRAAVPGPLVATFLAAASGLVDGAVDGSAVVGWVPADTPTVIEHLEALDHVLVVSPDGVRLVPPPAGLPPVTWPLDPLTPAHHLEAAPGGGEPVGDAATAARLRREGSLLAAAVQVGLGAAAVDLGAGYATQRTQFGKVIGGFQAVKHLLADAHVGLEVARAAVHAAAVTIDEGGDGGRLVDGARIVASEAARHATEACIQVHGGLGYTWELDAHLLLKRVLVLDVAFATVEDTFESLAATL